MLEGFIGYRTMSGELITDSDSLEACRRVCCDYEKSTARICVLPDGEQFPWECCLTAGGTSIVDLAIKPGAAAWLSEHYSDRCGYLIYKDVLYTHPKNEEEYDCSINAEIVWIARFAISSVTRTGPRVTFDGDEWNGVDFCEDEERYATALSQPTHLYEIMRSSLPYYESLYAEGYSEEDLPDYPEDLISMVYTDSDIVAFGLHNW